MDCHLQNNDITYNQIFYIKTRNLHVHVLTATYRCVCLLVNTVFSRIDRTRTIYFSVLLVSGLLEGVCVNEGVVY